MRNFIYEKFSPEIISSSKFCFKTEPYFCPLIKQDERWTSYIEIKKFSPEINDTNSKLFKKLHPYYKYFPDDIKLEKRLRENYLFYYDHPRISETVLLNFNPKEGWNELLPYLELTEIISAKVEQQRIKANKDIEATRGIIKNIRSRAYSSRDVTELELLQKNLSSIDIDNSTASKLLKELEILERWEKEILQGMDDIFHLVYLGKIRNHHDFLLRDIEILKSAMASLQMDHDETKGLAENKIHSLVQEEQNQENIRWTQWGVLAAIISVFVAIALVIYSTHTPNTFLKNYAAEVAKLTEKQIESLNKNSQNIIGKLDELIHSSKQKEK